MSSYMAIIQHGCGPEPIHAAAADGNALELGRMSSVTNGNLPMGSALVGRALLSQNVQQGEVSHCVNDDVVFPTVSLTQPPRSGAWLMDALCHAMRTSVPIHNAQVSIVHVMMESGW